ncbi:putative Aminoglycoside phosphotransferase domain-containing protein [Seiridium cardinale]|uniref:Aminoglycoside phosphotransferase domain-containing protein n=1 Tax=Seiridium cardinale TaxID=138064 RepID=A0ABR2XAK4_9PEZI
MGLIVKLIGSGVGFASEAFQASRSRSTASSSSNPAPSASVQDAPPEYVEVADEATADHMVRTGQAERVDKQPQSKTAVVGHEQGEQSSSDDEDEAAAGNDEAAWELDDMVGHVASPGNEVRADIADDANDSEEVKIKKEEQMVRDMVQMAGPPPQPPQRLPCAVILPQRRPRDKTRGFVRAYAPVLQDCGISQDVFLRFLKDWYQSSKADPWIDVVFMAAGIVGLVPEVAAQVVGAVAQVVAGTAKELQSRYRQNTFLDRVNENLLMPRGLYALVMTFKDETPEAAKRRGPLTKLASTVGKNIFTQERLDINQTVEKYSRADETMSDMRKKTKNIRLFSGKTVGQVELPKAAALIYPDLDSAADQDLGSNDKGKEAEGVKEKWKGAGKWVQDYLDRRAQAAYEMDHHGSTLNVPSESRTPFLSRYSDPSHAARSGSLISLLTGGAVNPAARRQEKRSAKQERRAAKRDYKDERRVMKGREPRGPRRVRLPRSQRKGIIKRIMQKDVLYLLIVNLPTQDEVQHSAAQLEQIMNRGLGDP